MDIGKPHPDKRTRLIETAMNLAYRNGFRETSLADIAQAAHVPVGNVYYYFKTKEELGEAVVERRLAQFREFREEIDRLSSPKERLFAFAMGWFEEQFRAAGHEEDARELSAHLFCAYQGMAAVAHAANDPDLVVMEVKRLKDWIGTL